MQPRTMSLSGYNSNKDAGLGRNWTYPCFDAGPSPLVKGTDLNGGNFGAGGTYGGRGSSNQEVNKSNFCKQSE